MKLWPIPQDVDEEISMMLSITHKTNQKKYTYDVVKICFRNKEHGRQHKMIQLLSMTGEESPRRYEQLTDVGRSLYVKQIR